MSETLENLAIDLENLTYAEMVTFAQGLAQQVAAITGTTIQFDDMALALLNWADDQFEVDCTSCDEEVLDLEDEEGPVLEPFDVPDVSISYVGRSSIEKIDQEVKDAFERATGIPKPRRIEFLTDDFSIDAPAAWFDPKRDPLGEAA